MTSSSSALRPRILLLWRLHILLLSATLIATLVGTVRIPIASFEIILLPLVFAFIAGLLLNPNVTRITRNLLDEREVRAAASSLGIAVMPLMAFLSSYIGPSISEIADAGAALVLQELGNLGTMLFAMPLAVVVFKMGREALGATFSIAREGGLAFIFSAYGGDSPEAKGVLGVYICGTFFGTAFFAIMPGVIASLDWFDLRALAMGCGTGSASMTAACSAALADLYPASADEIAAFAASSNLITAVTGVLVTVFITLPVAELYYRVLSRQGGGQ
ncbi:MAG: DUF3100 domain-containing protein [Pseudomonadota bacterium]